MLWHFQAVSHDDTALTCWSVFQAQLQEWQPSRTEHAQSSSIIFHSWLKHCEPFLYRTEQQSDWHLSEPKVKWREKRRCSPDLFTERVYSHVPLSVSVSNAPQTKPASLSAHMVARHGLIHLPTDTYNEKHFHIFWEYGHYDKHLWNNGMYGRDETLETSCRCMVKH